MVRLALGLGQDDLDAADHGGGRVLARLAGLLLGRLEFRAVEQLVDLLLARGLGLGFHHDREAGRLLDLLVGLLGDRPDPLQLVVGQLEPFGQRRTRVGHRGPRTILGPGERERALGLELDLIQPLPLLRLEDRLDRRPGLPA